MLHRPARKVEGRFELRLGLLFVGLGERFRSQRRGELNLRRCSPRAKLHRGDDRADNISQATRSGTPSAGASQGIEEGFGLGNLADRQQERGKIDLFVVGRGYAIGRVSRRGAQQVTGAIGGKRVAQGGLFVGREFEFIEVEDAGVVKAPLDDVGGVNDCRPGWHLSKERDALFAAREADRADSGAQLRFALEDREHGAARDRVDLARPGQMRRPRVDAGDARRNASGHPRLVERPDLRVVAPGLDVGLHVVAGKPKREGRACGLVHDHASRDGVASRPDDRVGVRGDHLGKAEGLAPVDRHRHVGQFLGTEGVVLEKYGGLVGVPGSIGIMGIDLDPRPVGRTRVVVGQIRPLGPRDTAIEAAVNAGVQDVLRIATDLPVIQRPRSVDRVRHVTDGVRVGRPQVREVDPVWRAGEFPGRLPRRVPDPAQ